jgi:hypothetical protein
LSIRALVSFNDLELLKKNFNYKKEKLPNVLSEFARACTKINPNDRYTIDLIAYLIVNRDINILPHPNFDFVSSSKGIKYLLKKLIKEEDTLFRSLKNNHLDTFSIKAIIKNINEVYDEEIFNLIVKLLLLKSSYETKESLLYELSKMANSKKENFIFFIFNKIKTHYTKDWWRLNNILSNLLTIDNAEDFIKEAKKIPDSSFGLTNLFFRFESQDPVYNAIYEIGRQYFPQEYSNMEQARIQSQVNLTANKYLIYEQFKTYLSNDNKYLLFKFFNDNRIDLLTLMSSEEKQQLEAKVRTVVTTYDFKDTKLIITDPSRREYNIPNTVIIFDRALFLLNDFNIQIDKTIRTNMIAYLPFGLDLYTGHDDNLYKLLGNLNKEETSYLVNFYKTKRSDDLFTLTTKVLFSFYKKYKVVQLTPVIKEIILNWDYDKYIREEALYALNLINLDLPFLKRVFNYYTSKKTYDYDIALSVNDYLIINPNEFQEKSIDWRIKELIKNPRFGSFSNHYDYHQMEQSLHGFNKSLCELNDDKFKNKFLELLKESISMYEKGNEYKSYAYFLWNTIYGYFDNLKILKSYKPLKELDKSILSYKSSSCFHSLQTYFGKLKVSYMAVLSKPNSFSDCIKKYNQLKQNKYLTISSSQEFYYLIEDILNNDIRNWIEKEGAYKLISQNIKLQETLIQKTIQTQFENGLLKRGLRDNEVRIVREEQLLDDTRTDFVISYGFIGQILIEIKRTKNPDVKDKKYRQKLIQYMDGTNSDYGVFLIFQMDEDEHKWNDIEPIVNAIYFNDRDRIKVIGMDCTVSE